MVCDVCFCWSFPARCCSTRCGNRFGLGVVLPIPSPAGGWSLGVASENSEATLRDPVDAVEVEMKIDDNCRPSATEVRFHSSQRTREEKEKFFLKKNHENKKQT